MYHLYQTVGYVLKSTAVGEANRRFDIFTRELGRVRAVATSVRLSRSKLNVGLLDFEFSEFSLVRGKGDWRLTSAKPVENIYYLFSGRGEREKVRIIARVFALIDRLVPEEEKNEKMFDVLAEGIAYFIRERFFGEDARSAEAILVLRVLYCLGYIGEADELDHFYRSSDWSLDVLKKMHGVRKVAFAHINKALLESHL
jgi:DNA repair protein RecO (recombination protein O)